jgi:hypothetical protein
MDKKSPAFCKKAFDAIAANHKKVDPKDDKDWKLKSLYSQGKTNVGLCFAKSGDCKNAWKHYKTFSKWEIARKEGLGDQDDYLDAPKERQESMIVMQFNRDVQACAGKASSAPRDQLYWALQRLAILANDRKAKASQCDKHFKTVEKFRTKVKPADDEDKQIINLWSSARWSATACYANAGDCKKAFSAFKKADSWNPKPPKRKLEGDALKRSFEATAKQCKK